MFTQVFTPIMNNIFSEAHLIDFGDKYSRTTSQYLSRLYVMLCSGGFKDPVNFFSETSISKQMHYPHNLIMPGF